MKQFLLSIIFPLLLIISVPVSSQETALEKHEDYHIEKIYPNPVTNQVFVNLISEKYTVVQFELINILGNKVKHWKKIELVPGNQKIKLDLHDLNAGFYLLKVTAHNKTLVKRIRKL